MTDLCFPSEAALDVLKLRSGQLIPKGCIIGVAYSTSNPRILATNLVFSYDGFSSERCNLMVTRLKKALTGFNTINYIREGPENRGAVNLIPYLGVEMDDIDPSALYEVQEQFTDPAVFGVSKTGGAFYPNYDLVVVGTPKEVKTFQLEKGPSSNWIPAASKIDSGTDESQFSDHIQRHLMDDSEIPVCLSVDLFKP